MCETVARLSHEERKARKRKAAEAEGAEAAEEEDDEDGEDAEQAGVPEQDSKLGRIKRGFLRKVFSPIVGYGTDYELLHFVYDLSMWTTVGTKKNVARQRDVPLRLVLKRCPWTPQYWRIRHQAVVDMQRQCGNATLFRTRAPYEKTFPYHEWVMHEQRLAGRPRLHLAGPETLHMAHVLVELDKAFMSGSRGIATRADRSWTGQHLLGPCKEEGDENPPQTVLSRVTRLEFQDGKRKLGKQAYHGRGTVHSHSLDFLQNVARIELEKKLSAHLPDKQVKPLLHGLVLDGQCDRTNSGLEVREEASAWDPETSKVLLQHTEEDKELKIRPYFIVTMEITKCHEDVQQADGNGAVLRYVATYSLKFSDSMDKNWLNDQASDYSVARRILFCYHPLEPEMWLTLANERFPQVDYKGTLFDIQVPLPNCTVKPRWLLNYEKATWRRDGMPLLEFLRKSNADGKIIRYIQESYKHYVRDAVRHSLTRYGHGQQESQRVAENLVKAYNRMLQEKEGDVAAAGTLAQFVESRLGLEVDELAVFANTYVSRGEKLVAASTYSMLNDRYYGQWVVLRTPFRDIAELNESVSDQLAKATCIS